MESGKRQHHGRGIKGRPYGLRRPTDGRTARILSVGLRNQPDSMPASDIGLNLARSSLRSRGAASQGGTKTEVVRFGGSPSTL